MDYSLLILFIVLLLIAVLLLVSVSRLRNEVKKVRKELTELQGQAAQGPPTPTPQLHAPLNAPIAPELTAQPQASAEGTAPSQDVPPSGQEAGQKSPVVREVRPQNGDAKPPAP